MLLLPAFVLGMVLYVSVTAVTLTDVVCREELVGRAQLGWCAVMVLVPFVGPLAYLKLARQRQVAPARRVQPCTVVRAPRASRYRPRAVVLPRRVRRPGNCDVRPHPRRPSRAVSRRAECPLATPGVPGPWLG